MTFQWYMATVLPFATLADIAILIGVACIAVRLRKRSFWRDESGVAAVEAAIGAAIFRNR